MLETLEAIMDRCRGFLMEKPRANWVSIKNNKDVKALLFYSSEDSGICIQFIDDGYCYCFSDSNAKRWIEVGSGTLPTEGVANIFGGKFTRSNSLTKGLT